MKFKVVKNGEINEFLDGLDAAFKGRSGDHLPYEPLEKEKIIGDDICNFGLFDETNKMVGGLTLKASHEYDKCGSICHVWVHPNEQHRGIGKLLLQNIEKYCVENNYEYLTLGVSNIYKPAVNLYRNYGFKKYKIYANVPNTYYFIGMIKYLNVKENKLKRLVNYMISKIKFVMLFKKDSSPKVLHKLIFESNKTNTGNKYG